MKNYERYTTPEELEKAFSDYCQKHSCSFTAPYYDDKAEPCKHEEACKKDNEGNLFSVLAFAYDEAEPLPEPELETCPCCGGIAELIECGGRYYVRCKDCSIQTGFGSLNEVVATWNTRAWDRVEK